MSRTSVTYFILQGMKCRYCGKLYVKPRCLQNHVILRHSISISMPPIHKEIRCVLGGGDGPNTTSRHVLREVQNFHGTTPQRTCPSIVRDDASGLTRLQPTTGDAVVNPALAQHQHHSSERERNPILTIDILGLCGDDLYPSDQQKQDLPSAGPMTGEPEGITAPNPNKSLIDVLDAIEFDEEVNAGEVDDKNIQIAQEPVPVQLQSPPEFSGPPEVVAEEDSQFLEKITCIEDLCKFK